MVEGSASRFWDSILRILVALCLRYILRFFSLATVTGTPGLAENLRVARPVEEVTTS